MKDSTRFLVGVILIALGILFLVEQTGIFGIHIPIWSLIWTFWPLILIFLGAKLLIQGNHSGGLILLVLGVVFLSTTLFKWNFFAVLWPIIIITIGASILLRRESSSVSTKMSSSKKDLLNETVVFWGVEKKIESQEFKGGEINVGFGGITLDLRDAKIAESGAKLHINCAFGSVEILVPDKCRIVSDGTGILGGWDVSVEKREVTKPILTITGSVVLGGVDIK